MDFGKISIAAVDEVDFRFAPESGDNERVLSTAASGGAFKAWIGLKDFAEKDWVGTLYPKGTKDAQKLAAYARVSACIESNHSFYGVPDADLMQRWHDTVAADFRFCCKFPKAISHEHHFELLPAWADVIRAFGAQAGPSFVQFAPEFAPPKKAKLDQFLQLWPADLPLAVELRHPDWLKEPARSELAAQLEQQARAWCITDTAGRRDACHMQVTAPFVFVRFAGNDLHKSDFARLDAWAEKLHLWQSYGLREAYFFIHQPEAVSSIRSIEWLGDRLRDLGMEVCKYPRWTERPDPQLNLFA